MTIKEEIIRFVEYHSLQQFEGDLDSNELEFATRENGDVGEEEYSQYDYQDAQDVLLKTIGKFNHLIDCYSIDTCDEWVNLVITLK